jgi:hypothetical protein
MGLLPQGRGPRGFVRLTRPLGSPQVAVTRRARPEFGWPDGRGGPESGGGETETADEPRKGEQL